MTPELPTLPTPAARAPRLRRLPVFPETFEGAALVWVRFGLVCAVLYAVLSNLAGLGYRITSLSSGDLAALFRDNPLFLGLRVGSSALAALVYCTFAMMLAWHKAHHPYAALTALTLLTTAITAVDLSPALELTWVDQVQPLFSALNTALLLYLLLLFPQARFRSRAELLLGHGWALFCLSSLLIPGLPFNVVYFESWTRTPLPSLLFDFLPFLLGFLALVGTLRHHPSVPHRRQGRWFLGGTLCVFFGVLLSFALRALPAGVTGDLTLELLRPVAVNVLLLGLPLALGVAHWRHGLFSSGTYEGEVVLEQTLTQLLLAALLLGVYVALLRLLGPAVPYGTSLVIVVSATAFALLLQPLRGLIAGWVGQALHGRREDPYQVISSLSRRLELSGHPEGALLEIGRTLEHGLSLPSGRLELCLQGQRQTVHRWGKASEHILLPGGRRFSLIADGEPIGELWVASRRPHFSQQELELLREVSRHTGRVMQSLRLQLELQRSREQRTQTFEAELKRLRNELHDGISPTLVGLVRHLDVAMDGADLGPEQRTRLEGVQSGLLGSVRELRRVIYGLRPPALDELGLLGALREQAAGMPCAVRLELPDPQEFAAAQPSAALEVAIFRIVQEALNNIVRHAGASSAGLRLHLHPQRLELCIWDDGRGRIGTTLGIGIRSMRERAEELGGSFRLESGAAPALEPSAAEAGPLESVSASPQGPHVGGTRLTVWLPLRSS